MLGETMYQQSKRKAKRAFIRRQSLQDIAIIRIDEVLSILQISKSALYEGIEAGLYAPGLRIGKRATGWSRQLVLATSVAIAR